MNPNFEKYLLKITKASSCEEKEVIQSLWSGYGQISRFALQGSPYKMVVVKCINTTSTQKHPRGWNTNNSHKRKMLSYQIETWWYQQYNEFCAPDCRTPKFIGAFKEGNQWIVLEDLNTNFPLRKTQLNFSEVKVCLKWLASFHAIFLNRKPTDLWNVGSYWHLETRLDEFEKIEHQELKAKAHKIDEILNRCQYQTIIHGDAKLANFCFSKDSKEVAAVDFQYVGGGCGMKDVAYFLGSCLSSDECALYETALLDYYFSELQKAIFATKQIIDFNLLEAEWRKMYPLACTDFTRFLMGWMPSHQKINEYNLNLMQSVLSNL